MRKFTIFTIFILYLTLPAAAQPRITNTPVPAVLPQATATSPETDPRQNIATPSPTFTPTVPPPDVLLEAAVPAGSALVRDFPETGTVIGTLNSGERYGVIGSYFSWIYFQYAPGADGRAWIYVDNVALIGDINEIPFVDPNALQPPSPEENATATAVAQFQTPGFVETATANARVLAVPTTDPDAAPTSEFPPTYTPPAEVIALAATPDPILADQPASNNTVVTTTLEQIAQGNIPPVVSIVGLLLFGSLGLLIALIRR